MGRRCTSGGSSSLRVNRRWRISAADKPASSAGLWRRFQAMSSLRLVGWSASGHMRLKQPCSGGNMPETCKKGCACCWVVGRPSSWATRSFLCSARAKSKSFGLAWRSRRASAMVARTSDKASWALVCSKPLAALRCSSLKLGLPSSWRGQLMPCGRRA